MLVVKVWRVFSSVPRCQTVVEEEYRSLNSGTVKVLNEDTIEIVGVKLLYHWIIIFDTFILLLYLF